MEEPRLLMHTGPVRDKRWFFVNELHGVLMNFQHKHNLCGGAREGADGIWTITVPFGPAAGDILFELKASYADWWAAPDGWQDKFMERLEAGLVRWRREHLEGFHPTPAGAGGKNTFKLRLQCVSPSGERYEGEAVLRPEDFAKGPTQGFIQDWLADFWLGVQARIKGVTD